MKKIEVSPSELDARMRAFKWGWKDAAAERLSNKAALVLCGLTSAHYSAYDRGRAAYEKAYDKAFAEARRQMARGDL